MQVHSVISDIVLRCGRLMGKPRAERWARRFAYGSRRLAELAHLQVLNLHWKLPPQPEWQDQYTSLFLSWRISRQPFTVERGCVNVSAIRQGADVLSICCGDGFYDNYFHSGRARQVTAVDFDPEAIAFARKYNSAPNVSYEVCDIRERIPDGPFDNIIWNGAIEHFTPAEIAAILQQLKSRLKPGGILSGSTIAAIPGETKQLSHHEYEFQSKEDLLRFFTPHFANAKVMEANWPPAPNAPDRAPRHNLYFYAGDGMLPYDADWPRWAISRTPAVGAA